MSKKEQALSPLAKKAEVTLRKVLDAMARDIDQAEKTKNDPKYSLTDLMKVTDRALKLEAIRLSIKSDDDGSFFTSPLADEPTEGANEDDNE